MSTYRIVKNTTGDYYVQKWSGYDLYLGQDVWVFELQGASNRKFSSLKEARQYLREKVDDNTFKVIEYAKADTDPKVL